jgi:cytochrome c
MTHTPFPLRVLAGLATALLALSLTMCGQPEQAKKVEPPAGGGDAGRGRLLIQQYGCQSCHSVPGLEGPKGVVGPPLDKLALRTFIGGKVQNTPANMIVWLQNPQAFDPANAMPNIGVTPADARDLTAFLFTLK